MKRWAKVLPKRPQGRLSPWRNAMHVSLTRTKIGSRPLFSRTWKRESAAFPLAARRAGPGQADVMRSIGRLMVIACSFRIVSM